MHMTQTRSPRWTSRNLRSTHNRNERENNLFCPNKCVQGLGCHGCFAITTQQLKSNLSSNIQTLCENTILFPTKKISPVRRLADCFGPFFFENIIDLFFDMQFCNELVVCVMFFTFVYQILFCLFGFFSIFVFSVFWRPFFRFHRFFCCLFHFRFHNLVWFHRSIS